RLGSELGIPLVATNDVHYLRQEDAAAHDVLLCIQTGNTVDDPKRLRFHGDQFYLKSPEEMAALFPEHGEALARTREVADRCNVKLALGEVRLPHFEVPPGYDHDSYLRELCLERLPARYPKADEAIKTRLEDELDVIRQRQLAQLILISWDAVHFARENGILVGPGRGSAVGSVVLYVLGVTNVDPIEHGLPFERWMNLERLSMPDIDSDFEDSRRDEVIRHISERYGAERVAQIITFGTMGARLAIRDAGRAMRMPLADVDRLAKMVDPTATISQSLDTVLELSNEYQRNPEVRKLLDTAMAVEGLARHASTHAGGLVISECPLTDIVPLQRSTEGEGVTTQFKWEDVVDVGLLKLDILGLRTLSVIKHALALIHESRSVEPDLDLDRIPFDDRATYELLARGETAGVFQLESAGMRQVLMDLRPDRFAEIIAVVALYRPGPMAHIADFISGRHGRREITYAHPKLKPILEATYGIIVYQEQVMQIARDLAGFSMASADALLNAMRKKKHEAMGKLREEFIEGAKANRVSRAVADDIFDRMAVFAGYGFNKAHAACYALNAYQTAYLKANYPAEFIAAQLTSVGDTKDKLAAYIEECRRMGIRVLPPDINQSGQSFTVSGNTIRFGLAAIKHAGRAAVESIIRAREQGGPFAELYDLCARVDTAAVNKTAIDALIKAGALDCLPGHRGQLLEAAGDALDAAHRAQRDRQAGQAYLFDGEAGAEAVALPSLPDTPELSQDELLALEKEYLGLFVSDHPLSSIADELAQQVTARAFELPEIEEGSDVILGGVVNSCRRYTARNGRPMMFLGLEDMTGSVEVTVFPDAYERCGGEIASGVIALVRGKVEKSRRAAEQVEGRSGASRMVAFEVARLDDADAVKALRAASRRRSRASGGNYNHPNHVAPAPPPPTPERPRSAPRERVHIRMPAAQADTNVLQELKQLLRRHRGDDPVLLHLCEEASETSLALGRTFSVAASDALRQEIESFLGEGAVWRETL
ncbi:MAG: DNA polymerase III subunit alpha, partial [Armatimonadota bacterium]